MSDRRVLLVIAVVLLAPVWGAVVVSAAPVENDTYAVAQGTSCTVVEPVTNESRTAAAFYDYRNPNTEPNSSTFSSFGTTAYQETLTSALLFYEGSEDASIVLLHGELGDGLGGSTLTMAFEGLPADGEWVVEDDEYENRDDDWSTGGTTATIDWKWGPNRTDGGVYSGIGNASGPIVITPGFNEDAAHWGEWSYSGSDANRIDAWRLIDADGSETLLARDRRLFIHGGGCEATPPSAALTGPSSAETGESVTLDAGGTTDDGTIGGYEWDFDADGEFEAVTTDPTVEHAFEDAGNRTVVVTAFDTYGNGDGAELRVNVTAASTPPNASLDAPATATVNESVTLDASNSTDEGTITSYEWDFDGDGAIEATSTDPVLEHTFDERGTVEPAVTVVDDDNETATGRASIEIQPANQPPTAALDAPAEVRVGQSVTFDASNATDDQGVAQYRWEFDGDGTIDATTTEPTVDHTYGNTSESVEASVTVVDSAGLNDTASATVAVLPDESPTASLDAPANATVGAPATFDASNATDDVGIAAYRWDFDGDGVIEATTTTPVVRYSYDSPGRVRASVTVVDAANQTAAASASVLVRQGASPPSAALSVPADATVGQSLTFDARNASDEGAITSYEWDFDGNGTIDATTAEPTVEYAYDDAGEFAPVVTVVDDDNETATATGSIAVVAADWSPNVRFDPPSEVRVDEPVTLNVTVSTDGEDADGGDDDGEGDADDNDEVEIEAYRWDLDGDGTVDTETEASTVAHTFTEPGQVSVGVTVVADDGRTASTSTAIAVGDPANATAAFTVETPAPTAGDPVSFNATDATASTPIVSYDWAFGDSEAGTGVTVDHAYNTSGEYEVTLSITTEGGVTANASTTVNVAAAGGDDGGDNDGGTSGGGGNDGGNDGGSNDGGSNDGGNDGGSNDGGNDGGSNDGGTADGSDDDDTDSGGSTGGQSGGQSGGEQSTATPEPEPEPDIGQANVTLGSQELLVGETLVAEATVTNRGNASGIKTVEFEVEGEELESRRIPLGPGESRTVSFTHQFTAPGTKSVEVDQGRTWQVEVRPREPNISIASLRVDEREVAPGEQFTIVANVTNTGDAPGERTVALELFGETVATENVSLAVGDTARVTFTRSVVATGSYDATVGNQSVRVTVVEETATAGSSSATTTNSPGLGALSALVALAAATVALVRRRG